MAEPLVAEFSACTSTYGRLAPLPPVASVAAEAAVTGRARTPTAASIAVLTDQTRARLRSRMEWSTYHSLHGEMPELFR